MSLQIRGWRHSIEPADALPEVAMMAGVYVVTCRAMAKKLARYKRHGLPRCEPSQSTTLLFPLAALDLLARPFAAPPFGALR